MKAKLMVLGELHTPKNAKRRIVLGRDESLQEWVRDDMECTFVMWSNVRRCCGDRVYDPLLKRKVDAESPYEEVLDADGCATGETRLREGLLAFDVDMFEHSGRAWALSCDHAFTCPWDTVRSAFVLYCDRRRWESLGGDAKWEFVDGKPSDALLEQAREIAREEIRLMNLCESGSYYRWREERLVHEASTATLTHWDGRVETVARDVEYWEEDSGCESCGGILTDAPAEDADFPAGVPVVTDDPYLEGKRFDQQCWALSDIATGKYLAKAGGRPKFVDDASAAFLSACRGFLDANRKAYEGETGRELAVVDVTEEVWTTYPECIAEMEGAR